MDLRHLRYFTVVAETLNFTRAAESLYISQSTLSQQIADLEQELDTKLFERTRRSVALTPSGQRLLPEARRILTEVNQVVATIKDEGDAIPRFVRIGLDARIVNGNRLSSALADRLFQIREHYPSLRTDFFIREHDQLVRSLESGALDIIFSLHQHQSLSEDDDRISSCLLGTDELVLAVRTSRPTPDTLENLRAVLGVRGVMLLEGESRGLIQATRVLESIGIEPDIHFSPDRDAMLLSLSSGDYAIILPKGIVSGLDVSDLHTLHFPSEDARLHALASWRTDNANPLIPFIVEAAREAFAP